MWTLEGVTDEVTCLKERQDVGETNKLRKTGSFLINDKR